MSSLKNSIFVLVGGLLNLYNLWSYGNADDISATIINKLVKRIKNDRLLDK